MKCKLVNDNFTSNYVENLLRSRGVTDIEEYIKPTIKSLQNPEDLKNIGQAAALYLRVVLSARPRILIVVDSDTDGFTSATIIYQYTMRVNCHAQISYILHEGKQHGLQDHIDKIMQSGSTYDLIILPDSSSNDAHYHDMLETIHLPCLILDHHLTDVALSDNAIVVNNQLSPNYKNKELTGAGIVYQFCRYIDKKLEQTWADDYQDLASFGIIADMGSLLELENRYIIFEGLHHPHNSFFIELIEKQSYSITGTSGASFEDTLAKLTPISVAFYMVPLINALIRVGTMEEKDLLFQAFLDGDQLVTSNKRGAVGSLERAAVEAIRVCNNAKTHQNKIKEAAVERIQHKIEKEELLENRILFVKLDKTDIFPSELNGLIATQLSVRYKKPTIVARLCPNGYDRGSIRGLNQSELTDFKSFLTGSGLFEYVQGHANAAGCSILDSNIDKLYSYANDKLKGINFGENSYDINFIRNAFDSDLADLIFEIGNNNMLWGQNTPCPLINVKNIKVNSSNIRIMGKESDTVKIEVNGVAYMKFKAKEFINQITDKDSFTLEVVGEANLNTWGGRTTPQIFITDYDIKTNLITDF